MSGDQLPSDKAVVFRFIGGPRDAGETRSDAPPGTEQIANEVRAYWAITKGGIKGHRIAAFSDKDAAAMTAEAFGGERVKNWRISEKWGE